MAVSAVSTNSTSISATQTSGSEIKALEKQKQKLQKQITEINNDKSSSAEEKDKQVQAIHLSIKNIDLQIQKLQEKKTETQNDQTKQTSAAPSRANQTAPSEKQLLRKQIDLEI